LLLGRDAVRRLATVVIDRCLMRELQLRDAKAAFSAVVEQAANGESTVVTRHGRKVAVVLGYDEWERLSNARRSLADLLLDFPDVGDIARDPAPLRDLDP
jgi:antitoxin Phd